MIQLYAMKVLILYTTHDDLAHSGRWSKRMARHARIGAWAATGRPGMRALNRRSVQAGDADGAVSRPPLPRQAPQGLEGALRRRRKAGRQGTCSVPCNAPDEEG